jgi:hypothetical protein
MNLAPAEGAQLGGGQGAKHRLHTPMVIPPQALWQAAAEALWMV